MYPKYSLDSSITRSFPFFNLSFMFDATLTMTPGLVAAALISLLIISTRSACPCNDATLCNNIKTNYTKELYGFLGGANSSMNDTKQYNFTYTTAFAVPYDQTKESGMDELMCTAHTNGVRMILWNYPGMPLTDNTSVLMDWIQDLFTAVTSLHYDGVTFDYEGPMIWTQPQSQQYTTLVNLTTQYFRKNLPGSTVSVMVPFVAYETYGRQYDYHGLSLASDYLYIMEYDVCKQ